MLKRLVDTSIDIEGIVAGATYYHAHHRNLNLRTFQRTMLNRGTKETEMMYFLIDDINFKTITHYTRAERAMTLATVVVSERGHIIKSRWVDPRTADEVFLNYYTDNKALKAIYG